MWMVIVALLPMGCGDDVVYTPPPGSGGGGEGGAAEPCTATLSYDPFDGSADIFPDDFFTVDANNATGVRVDMIVGDNITLPPTAPDISLVFDDLSTLDGFGTTAALSFQISAPVDASTLGEALALLNLSDGTPVPIVAQAFTEAADDPRTTIIVTPLIPLAPKTRHALVVTDALRADDSGCIDTSETMRSLLDGSATDPALTRLGDRYDALDGALSMRSLPPRAALLAATVFTTQHTVEDSAAIASQIAGAAVGYQSLGPCVDPDPLAAYLVCEGSFDANDFRVDGHHIDEGDLSPQSSYSLPVVFYLPKNGVPPYRTILFGHGLGGDRHQAEGLAELAAPTGYATVAIDAVKHGDHPDQPDLVIPGAEIIEFFGLGLGADPVDGRKLRDHFRQSTYDKLQLIEMLRPGVDVDGDMQPDVGVDELIYLGVSLGGIMSGEMLAFAPDVDVALPIVPGARVVDIIKDGAQFEVVINLLAGSASEGDIVRFFPLLQTIVDRGDPGAYLGHVMRDRLAGFDQQRPQLLMQMVLDDDTVPNSTNLFFARALDVPHVGQELLPIGVIPHEAALPVSGNVDASVTGGVFQYDIVYVDQGPATEPATHGNVARNPVSQEQTLHFIDSYYASGVSEILDPYVTLGIK
jgi:hypothetical protein